MCAHPGEIRNDRLGVTAVAVAAVARPKHQQAEATDDAVACLDRRSMRVAGPCRAAGQEVSKVTELRASAAILQGMISLIAHLLLGVAATVWLLRSNRQIFSKVRGGPAFSKLEIVYLLTGLLIIPVCYYFNHQFVVEYKTGADNPIWGPGSWADFIRLGYTNPAASSASLDYTVISVILFPIFAIVDGTRRGIRRPSLFIAYILFASSATALAFYLTTVERQRRHQKAPVSDDLSHV
jgi:Protein of unknown function DUF2834